MRTINIKERGRKRKSIKIHYSVVVIVSIILSFVFLLATEKSLAINALKVVFKTNRREIVYPTYDIYLEDLGEFYSTTIKQNLSKVQFENRNRFKSVDEKSSLVPLCGRVLGAARIILLQYSADIFKSCNIVITVSPSLLRS